VTTLAIALLVAVAPAGASARVLQDSTEILRNQQIVEMTNAGLGAELIVAKIRSSRVSFDVSVDEMIRLKQMGVEDEVLRVMLETAEAVAAAAPPTILNTSQPAVDPGVALPPTPPESGIYYARTLGREAQLVLIEPSVYAQSKETGVWKTAVTYGIAKSRVKVVLPQGRARIEIPDRRPTFYFFFDVPNAGLSSAGTVWGPATSANEFVLAKMEERKTRRELSVGSNGQYTGRSYGVDSKAIRDFSYDRVAPGVYRVTLKVDLADGEYCFLYAGSIATNGGGGAKLFDFRIAVPADAERNRRATKKP
jgi:hypothetical protein